MGEKKGCQSRHGFSLHRGVGGTRDAAPEDVGTQPLAAAAAAVGEV
jgi:hypothetical protein